MLFGPSLTIPGLARGGGLRPSAEWNFTTGFLPSGITYTGANQKYYTNSDGTLTSFASGAARLVENGRGLLAEEARTNLVLQSQDLATTWANENTTESVNQVAAPDGTTTADKLEETAASGFHRTAQFSKTVTNAATTFSIYAKADERDQGFVDLYDGTGAFVGHFTFDLGAETATASGITSAGIEALANGWYRVHGVYTPTAGSSARFDIGLSNDGSRSSYAGTAGNGLYYWGAQFETGALPSSYIPTTSATVTRAADVAAITGPSSAPWFNASKGTFLVEHELPNISATGNQSLLALEPIAITDFLEMRADNDLVKIGEWSGVLTRSALSTVQKSAFSYDVSGQSLSLSVAGSAVTTGTMDDYTGANTDKLVFGGRTGSRYLNGYIRRVAYWPVILDVQALTA